MHNMKFFFRFEREKGWSCRCLFTLKKIFLYTYYSLITIDFFTLLPFYTHTTIARNIIISSYTILDKIVDTWILFQLVIKRSDRFISSYIQLNFFFVFEFIYFLGATIVLNLPLVKSNFHTSPFHKTNRWKLY